MVTVQKQDKKGSEIMGVLPSYLAKQCLSRVMAVHWASSQGTETMGMHISKLAMQC